MSNQFAKFVFLAAVIGAVLFSRYAYPSAVSAPLANIRSSNESSSNAAAQILELPPVSVSANDAPGPTSTSAIPDTSSKNLPKVHDVASLVADLQDGTPYESLNADKRWPMASITKLMTASIAIEKMDQTMKITITPDMIAADPTEPTIASGDTYTVSDLLKFMLLPSSNVAAEAIADAYGKDAFLKAMNDQAAEWGMSNTFFGDPSGLTASNQSTAGDLLKLAQMVYAQHPEIFNTTRTPEATVTEQNSGTQYTLKSINNFAGEPEFIGGKTGHTDEASGNLLSLFWYSNKPVFIVVLGTNDRFGDTQKLFTWFKAR